MFAERSSFHFFRNLGFRLMQPCDYFSILEYYILQYFPTNQDELDGGASSSSSPF